MMQQAKMIDEQILQVVLKMGFDRSNLVEFLCNRGQNEGTIAYYLLLDNLFRVSSGYLGAEFQESMDGFNRMSSNEPASPIIAQQILGYMDYQGTRARPQFPVDRKWPLGLQVFDEDDVLYVFPKDYRSKLAAKSLWIKYEPLVEKAKLDWCWCDFLQQISG